jgi:NADH-quinone oxidoreductase subunit C
MNLAQDLIGKLNSIQITVNIANYRKCGYHLEVALSSDQVRDFAKMMRDDNFYLDFVTAVHVKPSFQVVYQFGHFDQACRVNAKAIASKDDSISTISDIFQGANWHERETHDFYGVTFIGHPDLRTLILSEEDADLKPLLKNEDKLVGIEEITRKTGDDAEKKPEKTKLEE